MKIIPVALAAAYATRQTSVAHALKVVRPDATIYGFTSHDIDDDIDGVTYSANPGLDPTAIEIAANAAVGNLELSTLHDGTVFTTGDVLGGVWRNADFVIFRYNWASLPADLTEVETLMTGTFGEVELRLGKVVVELRDLRQRLQESIGSVSSKTCRYRLGSTDKNNGGLCLKDVSGAPFTVTGALTHVQPGNQVFRDSSRAEGAAWFDEGELTFTSGPNAGIRRKVKTFSTGDGTFTLALPLYGTVAVGQTYTATSGCLKRREEDCLGKYGNVLNFGGEPDRKGINDLIKPAAASAASGAILGGG